MSISIKLVRILANRYYTKKIGNLTTPPDIQRYDNISYGPYGKDNLLDVYCPKNTQGLLPTIVSVHGGGFICGTKEQYQYYCMSLAQRGFVVVNFNYRLAPEWMFPTPLEDTNCVMEWLKEHAEEYHVDLDKVFMVGDSAGAQIANQYAVALTNPAYASILGIQTPAVTLKGLGLNCGLYDLSREAKRTGKIGMARRTYFGRDPDMQDERLKDFDYMTTAYPPAHITTASHDHLRHNAPAMAEVLRSKRIEVVCKEYGTEADEHLKHVFHLSIEDETANLCNEEQCQFFLQQIGMQVSS